MTDTTGLPEAIARKPILVKSASGKWSMLKREFLTVAVLRLAFVEQWP
jgi:hypothetical protein